MNPDWVPWIVILAVWTVVAIRRVGRDVRDANATARTITLMGETLACEDWRVTGRRHGRPLTEFCVTRREAEDARLHMRARGWRGVRIARHG